MPRPSFFPLFIMALLCASCQTDSAAIPPVTGTSMPMAHPQVVPARFGAGVLLGGWADSALMTALDDADRQRAQQAESRAFVAPLGQKVTWSNPASGASGTIVAVRDGYDSSGVYTRDFRQTVSVDGAFYQGYDSAAQQSDGSWKIVSIKNPLNP